MPGIRAVRGSGGPAVSLRAVMAVVLAAGLAAGATGPSPTASGSPVAAASVVPPASMIRGVVRAADTGRPLAGVSVGVGSTVDRGDWDYVLTDSQGRYQVRSLTAGGEYVLSFGPDETGRYLPRFAPSAITYLRAQRYRPPAVVDVVLPMGVPVSGRVTTSTGAPSDGATVRLEALDGGRGGARPRTDEDGRWSAVVDPGRYRISSTREDGTFAGYHPGGRPYARAEVVVVGPRGRSGVDLREPAPSRLVVTVVDAATRRPVDDVCVQQAYDHVEPPGGRRPGTVPGGSRRDGLTRSTGDVCEGPGGTYSIGVEPGVVRAGVGDRARDGDERYAPAITEPVRVGMGATVRVAVALAATGTLTGRVLDRVTGRPVRACVSAQPVAGGDLQGYGCAGRDGRWRLRGLSPGPVKVLVGGGETHVERYAPAAATAAGAAVYRVRNGATTTVPTVRLGRSGTITGRVLDARGRPVPGAGVELAGRAWWDEPSKSTTTDPAGRYRLEHVTTGPHRLEVVPPSYTGLGRVWVGGAGDAGRARAVRVPYGRTVSVPDQRLKAGARLAVVLGAVDPSVVVEALDPQGRIVGQAPVTLPIRPGRAGRTVVLTGLPATAVRVHAFSTRLHPDRESWLGGRDFVSAVPVALTAGRTVIVSMRAPAPVAPAPATAR